MKRDLNFLDQLFNARHGLAIWLLAYGALWVIVPLFSNADLPSDTEEVLSWAREWPMGVYRHPPIKIWLMEIAYQISGHWEGSAYVLSAAAYGVSQLAIYYTLRSAYSHKIALASIILSPTIFYFGSYLPQWNANVAQLPFAGLLLFFGWKALKTGKYQWWIGVGLAAACGIMSKYAFIMTMAAIFLAAITSSSLRQKLTISGLVISAVTFLIAVAPHTLWLYENYELISGYSRSRLSVDRIEYGIILGPLVAILLLIANSAFPAYLARFLLKGEPAFHETTDQSDVKWLIGWLAIFPTIMAAGIAAMNSATLSDAWYMTNLLFVPALLVIWFCGHRADLQWDPRAQFFIFGFIIVIALGYPGERIYRALYAASPTLWAPIIPPDKINEAALRTWKDGRQRLSLNIDEPIRIVGGTIEASKVANGQQGRTAKWLEHGNIKLSPWVTQNELKQHGMVYVGQSLPDLLQDYGICPVSSVTHRVTNMYGAYSGTLEIAAYMPIEPGKKDLCIE